MIRITSAAIVGLRAVPVDVEVDSTPGLHTFRIVGLPDKAVAESRERITSAIHHVGATPPGGENLRITVNLAPADLKKEGPSYDLPIALGCLAATEQVRFIPRGKLFVGEVGLDGALRPVRGVLAAAQMAAAEGIPELYVPDSNAAEAAVVNGLRVFPVGTLAQLIAHLEDRIPILPAPATTIPRGDPTSTDHDFALIQGQPFAKRALTIAAAGGHNVLLVGPPGTGKTLLARAMTTILPPLTQPEMIEVSTIFSVGGLLNAKIPLYARRPFRSPHHTASAPSIIGGGTHPTPGEVTLAHRGVLFLDELPEFRRDVLEGLRQPLEDRRVTITRAEGRLTFPAAFTLIAAMNPCPCGFRGDSQKHCRCSAGERARYERKLSGPLLDRIDLHAVVPRISHAALTGTATEDSSGTPQETSETIRAHVEKARAVQRERFSGSPTLVNAEMPLRALTAWCRPDNAGEELLRDRVDRHQLSARGYHRTLKVARTIADLENEPSVQEHHVWEALQYQPSLEFHR